MSNTQMNKKRIIFIVEGQNEMDYTLERRQKEERKLSIKTENNYQRQYNYLTDLFKQSDKYWVVRSSIKDLYEKIESLNCKPSTKLGYLNIFIIIKKCYNCKFDLLDNLRNELMNEKKMSNTNQEVVIGDIYGCDDYLCNEFEKKELSEYKEERINLNNEYIEFLNKKVIDLYKDIDDITIKFLNKKIDDLNKDIDDIKNENLKIYNGDFDNLFIEKIKRIKGIL